MNPRKALSKFLDAIGGIPEDNRDPLFGHINEQLRSIFIEMSYTDIYRELEREVRKRPNGRAYKLLGLAYFHAGRIDSAISALQMSLRCTLEDTVAIYEVLGYCYVLKDDWITAEKWFAQSDRFDFRGLVERFGRDFIYISALGKQQEGSPIFGLSNTQFVDLYRKLNVLAMMADTGEVEPAIVRQAATQLRRGIYPEVLEDVPVPLVFSPRYPTRR